MIVLHSITVVCPRLLTVGDSVLFFFSFLSFFLFNFIRCPCNVFDVLVLPKHLNQYILIYLLLTLLYGNTTSIGYGRKRT